MLVYPVDQATPRPSNQYIGRFLARSRQHGYKVMDRVAGRHPTAGRWIAATVASTVIRTRPRQLFGRLANRVPVRLKPDEPVFEHDDRGTRPLTVQEQAVAADIDQFLCRRNDSHRPGCRRRRRARPGGRRAGATSTAAGGDHHRDREEPPPPRASMKKRCHRGLVVFWESGGSRMARRAAISEPRPERDRVGAGAPAVSCGSQPADPCPTSSSVVDSPPYASPLAAATSPRWPWAARRIAPRRRTSARVARTSSGEDVGWPREILLASASLAHRVGFAAVQTLHPPMPADQTG